MTLISHKVTVLSHYLDSFVVWWILIAKIWISMINPTPKGKSVELWHISSFKKNQCLGRNSQCWKPDGRESQTKEKQWRWRDRGEKCWMGEALASNRQAQCPYKERAALSLCPNIFYSGLPLLVLWYYFPEAVCLIFGALHSVFYVPQRLTIPLGWIWPRNITDAVSE